MRSGREGKWHGNTLQIGALVIWLFAVSVFSTAQNSPPQPQPQTSATTNPAPFVTTLKKTVALLRIAFLKGNLALVAEGTGFFVFYADQRMGPTGGFMYLVTNRHVASPGAEDGSPYPVVETHVRLNLRNSTEGSEESRIPIGGPTHWYFPADDSVDLAVLPFLPDQARYDFLGIPDSIFATHDIVEARGISEGDSVLFTGYFYQFPGLKKFQPIIREGVLAMMPDEKMETTLKKPGRLYLADLHVFGGNSGSPLLVNLGGMRNGALSVGYEYHLLGIISGFYHEDSNLNLTIATTYTGTLEQNSGIAMVVPADELKALLDSSDVKAERDAEVARTKAQK
jgi:hypothetical protein